MQLQVNVLSAGQMHIDQTCEALPGRELALAAFDLVQLARLELGEKLMLGNLE